MSHPPKLSLWQKLKRLLTLAAAQPSTAVSREQVTQQQAAPSDTPTPAADMATSDSDDSDIHPDTNIDPKTTMKNKIALTKNSDSDIKPTPIIDSLAQYLHDKQWHYVHYRPRATDSQQSHHLSLRMRHKQLDCGYLFRVQESNALLAVYGILPFLIPESHQSAAMMLITQINYDMLIGNLEMDVNDGEIRYKNAIDVAAVGINNAIIEHLLQTVIAMTTVSYEIFSDLLNTQHPTEDMPTLLNELRQRIDERTFFLPTDLVQ